MRVLILGSFISLAAFLMHLLIWRVRVPKGQTRALALLFLTCLIFSFILLRGSGYQISLAEYLYIWFFVFSLAAFYIAAYTAIEADSPSLVMAINIYKAGTRGLSRDELLKSATDDLLVKPRIRDLLSAKMVFLEKDKYWLTGRGRLFIRVFIFYRSFLKLEKGG